MVLICESTRKETKKFSHRISLFRIRIDIEGASGTLYAGEKFQLLFKFTDQYPFDSPQVHCIDIIFLIHDVITFILGDFYRFTNSSPSTYLLQWSHLSLDINRRLVASVEYQFSVS